MTLVLVSGLRSAGAWTEIYKNPKAIFRDRSGSGATCWALFRKEDAPQGWKQVALPTTPEEFFTSDHFPAPTVFTWRRTERGVEIAVPPHCIGLWVGPKGRYVRALQEHLGTPVKVVPGVEITPEDPRFARAFGRMWLGTTPTEGFIAPWQN